MAAIILDEQGMGVRMLEARYATTASIATCDTLYDVFVLLWAEARAHEGDVQNLLEGDGVDFEEAEQDFGRRFSDLLEYERDATGRFVIGDGCRGLLLEGLGRFGLAAIVSAAYRIQQFAARPNERRSGALNGCFLDVAAVYGAPPELPLAAVGYEPPPREPDRFVERQLLTTLCVVPAEPTDVRLTFGAGPRTFGLTRTTRIALVQLRPREQVPTVVDLECGETLFRVSVDERSVLERLPALVDVLHALHVGVAILPELSMSRVLLDALRHELSEAYRVQGARSELRIVVAGSLHDFPQGSAARGRNSAYVLGPRGEELWRQDKLVPYEYGDGDAHRVEGLDLAEREIRLVDTSLGRVAVPICLDYLADRVADPLSAAGVNCYLVPAMSSRVRLFVEKAFANGRRRAATFVANADECIGDTDDEHTHSFVYLPVRGSVALRPFARARPGEGLRIFVADAVTLEAETSVWWDALLDFDRSS